MDVPTFEFELSFFFGHVRRNKIGKDLMTLTFMMTILLLNMGLMTKLVPLSKIHKRDKNPRISK